MSVAVSGAKGQSLPGCARVCDSCWSSASGSAGLWPACGPEARAPGAGHRSARRNQPPERIGRTPLPLPTREPAGSRMVQSHLRLHRPSPAEIPPTRTGPPSPRRTKVRSAYTCGQPHSSMLGRSPGAFLECGTAEYSAQNVTSTRRPFCLVPARSLASSASPRAISLNANFVSFTSRSRRHIDVQVARMSDKCKLHTAWLRALQRQIGRGRSHQLRGGSREQAPETCFEDSDVKWPRRDYPALREDQFELRYNIVLALLAYIRRLRQGHL